MKLEKLITSAMQNPTAENKAKAIKYASRHKCMVAYLPANYIAILGQFHKEAA